MSIIVSVVIIPVIVAFLLVSWFAIIVENPYIGIGIGILVKLFFNHSGFVFQIFSFIVEAIVWIALFVAAVWLLRSIYVERAAAVPDAPDYPMYNLEEPENEPDEEIDDEWEIQPDLDTTTL